MSSSNPMSASLTIQTIRVQPTTAAAAATETTTATAAPITATTVKTQELSGVWCPLLMTLANNTFSMSVNNEKPFAFNGNSRVLYKPQIQYYASNNSNKNNCYTTEPTIPQHQQQQKHLHHYHPNYCCRYCCRCRRYRQITSGLCDTINPQITKTISNSTNNLKVYCETDTMSTMITNENSFAYNLQNPLPSFILKPNPNSLLLLIISHESLHPIPAKKGASLKTDLKNYGGIIQYNGYIFTITREGNLYKCLIEVTGNNKIQDKTLSSSTSFVQYDDGIVKIEKNLENFSASLLKRN